MGLLLAACAVSAQEGGSVPLTTELPDPEFMGTPKPLGNVPNLEPPQVGGPEPLMVPEGVTNLAADKPVTSSDPWPIIGEPDFVTDGDKQGEEGYYVELGPGLQWVQIDLEQQAEIHAIWLWHYHSEARVYFDVVIQVSRDPDFDTGVTTVYNNDHDNSTGLGTGEDLAYIETNMGRAIPVDAVVGRYVRLYSAGNSSNRMNHYTEVEVFGLPTE